MVILLLSFRLVNAQREVDSLKTLLAKAGNDTLKCNLLNQLTEVASDEEWPAFNLQMKTIAESHLKESKKDKLLHKTYSKFLAAALNNQGFEANTHDDFSTAIKYFNQSALIQEEIGDRSGAAVSFNNMGQAYSSKGDMNRALSWHKKSLELREELKDKFGIAQSLNSIGYVYENLGDITSALGYFEQALKIREEIGNKAGIANTLNSLAWVYAEQGYLDKAMEYYNRSYSLRDELGDKKGAAWVISNLGLLYDKMGEKTKAYKCWMKCLKTMEAIGDKEGIAHSLNNLATVYGDEGDLKKALGYFERSLKLREEMEDEQGLAESLNNIGALYLKLKKFDKAEEFNLKAFEIVKRLGLKHDLKRIASTLNNVYKEKGDHKKALQYLELYVATRDSIVNEETRKASIKSQLKYEYGKKVAADSIEHAREDEIARIRMAKQESDLKAKKNQQYALYGGLALVLVFGIFMFNRVQLAQRQKKIIESQKHLVEEKQTEIMDSIHYARRIQKALFTSEKYIDRTLGRLKREKVL
jgi:tetratricopeptide (TPR) repeat protein